MCEQKSKVKITKGNNSRITEDRVMVLVHCTFPQLVLAFIFLEIYAREKSKVKKKGQ